jgi:hypothetical protein
MWRVQYRLSGWPAQLGRLLRRLVGLRCGSGIDSWCASVATPTCHPVSSHELGETHWWIRIRCAECGCVREVEVTNEHAQRFDRDLARRVKQIAVVLGRLDRERMISDSEAMTVALERDLIDPGDFCR